LFSHAHFLLSLAVLALSGPLLAADLVPDTGYQQVKTQCTVCHSAQIIMQNRSDREGWLAMIRWMQETQGLWPLGDAEPVILDYLANNYGPIETGRRQPLKVTFEDQPAHE
jgi:hypothetical protein